MGAMTSAAMLASCTLLYLSASESPDIDDASRIFAAATIRHIESIVAAEGQEDSYTAAIRKLLPIITQQPDRINQLADVVASGCRELAGSER